MVGEKREKGLEVEDEQVKRDEGCWETRPKQASSKQHLAPKEGKRRWARQGKVKVGSGSQKYAGDPAAYAPQVYNNASKVQKQVRNYLFAIRMPSPRR